MGVGDPTAPGVDGHEVGAEGFHYFLRDGPGDPKQALHLLLGEVVPPGDVPFGDDQTVALREGVYVQDGQG